MLNGICLLSPWRSDLFWNIDIAFVAQFFICLGYLFINSKKVKRIVLESHGIEWGILAGALLLINAVAGYLCIKLSGQSLDMSIGTYGNELLTVISAIAGIFFIVALSSKITWLPLVYLGQNTMVLFAWHSRIMIVILDYIYKYFGIFQESDVRKRTI